jgi:hypothetical protein
MSGSSDFVYSCIPTSACIGNGTCADGHTGFLCGTCSDGYSSVNSKCIKCSNNKAGFPIVFIILFFIAYFLVRNAEPTYSRIHSISIAITFLQIISLFGSIPVSWPNTVSSTYSVFSVLVSS